MLSLGQVILLGTAACSFSSLANAQQATSYSYDELGRLTSVLQSGGPASGNAAIYTYDAAGNRTNYISTQDARLSVNSTSASEGSPLSFIITRSGTTSNTVTVGYATSSITAIDGKNYVGSSGILSFGVGVTSQTVNVATNVDGAYTSDLTMAMTLSSPSSGARLGTVSATGTITNTDAQPVLSIAGASANEGADLNFIVTRSGSTGSAVTVNYATSNGTATSGVNYTASNGTLSFASGVTSQTIIVPTRVDGAYTSNLLMALNLSSPSGASLANAAATGTIVNSDPQPAITAINPTLSYSQSSVNSIDISALVNLNGRSGSVTSFVIPNGVGTATIATDRNSISYSAPYVGSSCDVAPVMSFSATYAVTDNGSGQTANGSATIKVKGSKKPIAQCLQ